VARKAAKASQCFGLTGAGVFQLLLCIMCEAVSIKTKPAHVCETLMPHTCVTPSLTQV
jgi:hypothetical protein